MKIKEYADDLSKLKGKGMEQITMNSGDRHEAFFYDVLLCGFMWFNQGLDIANFFPEFKKAYGKQAHWGSISTFTNSKAADLFVSLYGHEGKKYLDEAIDFYEDNNMDEKINNKKENTMIQLKANQKVFDERGNAYLTEANDFVSNDLIAEDSETDTAVCPDCGGKYLVNTGYCVSCDKKVADTDKAKESYASRRESRKAKPARKFKEASETPDWKEWEKEAGSKRYKWDFFDYHSGELSVKDIAKFMRSGDYFNDIFEDNIDYTYDVGFQTLKDFLRENDYDYDTLSDAGFDDELDNLRLAFESNMNFNVGSVMPSNLFFHDDEEIEMPDMYGLYEDNELVEDAKEFIEYARKHGFSEKDAMECLENATYGGMSGVGIIVEGGDIAEAITHDNYKLQGTCILYIADSGNGSGHYVIGNKSRDLKFANGKEASEALDTGRYCLGEVFGTSDWSYK